jgi:hypothetical protein
MSISTRIRKLEEELGPNSRIIVCLRPRDMTDDELEQHLHARGISTTNDDLVISLKRFAKGHPEPWVMIDGEMIDHQPA